MQCHNTMAKHWISLSLCYQTNLKCCAGDSLNKCYIRIFLSRSAPLSISILKENAVALTRCSQKVWLMCQLVHKVPILTTSCAWWTPEWKGWMCDVSHVKIWPKGQNKVFINVKCITLFSLDILVIDLFTFTGWPHKLHPGQRTLNWETITIYLLLFNLGQPWQCIFHSDVGYTRGIKSQGIVYFGV